MKIPTTVVTGYLGAGKTTIILGLIKQLQPDYQVVWLKNEYGNLSIDSELAKENNIEVKEMLNGCLCCVLVGKLKDALHEILRDYHPDRIIIESSGTAYPLPIVLEINEIPELSVDGVINVIDALNFAGYHDISIAARMQAECTDLTIINKAGLVDNVQLDKVLDAVYDLNPHTPVIKSLDGHLSKDLLLGLDHKQIAADSGAAAHADHHHEDEVTAFEFHSSKSFDPNRIEQVIKPLKEKDFIRIKGVVKTASGYLLLNWVLGRLTWEALNSYQGETKIVFMYRPGGVSPEQKIIGDVDLCAI